MTTSQRKSILSDVMRIEPIPRRELVYFRARLANRIHALVLEEFSRLEANGEINRAELGRRIGREPAQITRWLGSAGNWTVETLSDLMLGMGYEPSLAVSKLKEKAKAVSLEIVDSAPVGETKASFTKTAASAGSSVNIVAIATHYRQRPTHRLADTTRLYQPQQDASTIGGVMPIQV